MKAMYDGDLIGCKVITRSNEDEPCRTGTILGWERHGSTQTPLVHMDFDGKDYMVMGVVLPYHEKLLAMLDAMPYKEAYQLARDMSVTIQIVHRTRFKKDDACPACGRDGQSGTVHNAPCGLPCAENRPDQRSSLAKLLGREQGHHNKTFCPRGCLREMERGS